MRVWVTEMLYYLLYHVLQKYFSPLNVFRYITVRTVYASLTAMFLALVFGPWLIRRLRGLQIGQFIREEGPEEHKKKAGTPTMGGVLIVISTAVPVLLWADLANTFVLLALFAMLAFAAIGFVDDYSKVVKRQNLGLTGKSKLTLQFLVSSVVGISLHLGHALRVFHAARAAVFQAPAPGSGHSRAVAFESSLAFGISAVSGVCGAGHHRQL